MKEQLGRPAIYARFSSARQDERSIEDQVRKCREHLGDHRSEVEVFADYAVSGASLNRPGFEALMAAVSLGVVTSIVTEDLSRISRDFADAALIFKRLQYARVPLIGVADGIDTSAKHAKLTYTLKSLVAELYIDDLRDKTLRGLEGRMLAGFATGSVPFGYRTRPEVDGRGRETGKKIEIVDVDARIVIRIFTEFADGRGMSTIAHDLNREGIPSPRSRMRHRWSGWSVGSVREMLRNERYIGVWRFKTMQWVKVPGTNRRLPRKRPSSETMVQERPDLSIIEITLWQSVQSRLAKRARTGPRTKGRYLLSGILVCANCGRGLTVCGTSTVYYRCPTVLKGLCSNKGSLRMSPMLADTFEEIRRDLRKNPLLREVIEKHNGEEGDGLREQIEERHQQLISVEEQIERLLGFVAAGGDRLDSVAEKLRRLEVDARAHRAELEVLRRSLKAPLPKVSTADVDATVAKLQSAPPEEVEGARLRLRRWGTCIRFDGSTLQIELDAAALVADVAHRGTALPSYPVGAKLRITMPAGYLVPKYKRRALAA